MRCNPASINRDNKPILVAHAPDQINVDEEITLHVLDSNGKPTDEVRTEIVTKTIFAPGMMIDQSLSADDLKLSILLENNVPLQTVNNFSINSNDPDNIVNDVNAAVAQVRSKFVKSIETAVDTTPTENND